MSRLCIIVGLFVACCAFGSPLSANADTGSQAVQDLATLFAAYSHEGPNQNILDAAAKRIDFPAMTEMVFKPAQWASLTPVEKREVTLAFRKLVEKRYYTRWHKMFNRGKLQIAGEAKAGPDTFVKTFLTEPGEDESDSVIWRTRSKNGDHVLVSMSVNGKDLVSRLSPRFQKALEKRGANGLVAWMKERATDGSADDDGVVVSTSPRPKAH